MWRFYLRCRLWRKARLVITVNRHFSHDKNKKEVCGCRDVGKEKNPMNNLNKRSKYKIFLYILRLRIYVLINKKACINLNSKWKKPDDSIRKSKSWEGLLKVYRAAVVRIISSSIIFDEVFHHAWDIKTNSLKTDTISHIAIWLCIARICRFHK
jgi:hypothetical protein